ncbi:MAG: type II secretion system protein M [Alphaproteobacteria bacterium]|nr:type II secretion system protein M [Alphaproteobacteria bacterium]
MSAALTWWRERTPREQRLLAVMGAVAAAVLGWLLILRPLDLAVAAAAERHARAAVSAGRVAGMAEAIRRAPARAAPARQGTVTDLVARRATEAGVTLASNVAAGDARTELTIAAIRTPALLGWLGELQTKDGLRVDRVQATRNGDGTLAATVVLADPR